LKRSVSAFFVATTLSAIAAAQSTTRVSVDSLGGEGTGDSVEAVLSADGRFVAFISNARLASGGTNPFSDVYVHDRTSGDTTRVSVSSTGVQADRFCDGVTISADGRFVAFGSAAQTLVTDDTNHAFDVFVHDRQTGETARVSVSSTGAEGNRDSKHPSISASGRYVAFESLADALVAADDVSTLDIFVHDLESGETSRVSDLPPSVAAAFPSLSADGRYVAFATGFGLVDVRVYDRVSQATSVASVNSSGEPANDASSQPAISADGRFVAFWSLATNLSIADTNAVRDVFVHDRLTGETTIASVDSTGTVGNRESFSPSLSADGRFVTFGSSADNLVAFDSNANEDAFVHDRLTGETTRVSVDSSGTDSNGQTFVNRSQAISPDGRFVAFDSSAANLVAGDTNQRNDVFVRDRGLVCGSGTIDAGVASVVDVLRVNGGSVLVGARRNAPIQVSLATSASGPSPARYVLWIWSGVASRSGELTVGGTSIGCTVAPTPFDSSMQPQPIRCLRGAGVPRLVCGSATEMTSPPTAPWSVTLARGFPHRLTLTLQGLLQDDGAANARHFSTTNAVVLVVE
jgi:Tol biopolymer transport system component